MAFLESSQEESELGTVPHWVPWEAHSKREIRMFTGESFKMRALVFTTKELCWGRGAARMWNKVAE